MSLNIFRFLQLLATGLYTGLLFETAYGVEDSERVAAGQSYEPAAVNTFLLVADYYLVAHALAHGHTVVTHEIASTSTKKIKIPDACISLGIKVVTPYEMLRTERARFILGPSP